MMKLTDHEKDIINNISSGKIKDLYSYVSLYEYGKMIKIDRTLIESMFKESEFEKKYYWNKRIRRNKTNFLTEEEYLSKTQDGSITESNYLSGSLILTDDRGYQTIKWNNVNYEINLYEGVVITNKMKEIMDFICLCQYLKSEMLIVELPSTSVKENLGLFYEVHPDSIQNPINYDELTFDERYYWNTNISFSEERAKMCEEYIDRTIIPSSKLQNYINNGFKTSEEKAQARALNAAYIAIFVSVISIFVSILLQTLPSKNDEMMIGIEKAISEIKNDISTIRENIDMFATDYKNFIQNQ